MNLTRKTSIASTFIIFTLLLLLQTSCEEKLIEPPKSTGTPNPSTDLGGGDDPTPVEGVDYFLPQIDLQNWKVTLPIPREDGKALEVKPPAILDYANNEILKDFMYNDSIDGSLVFYTYPGATTTNSSYSRTELRELMDGENAAVNWTFAEGGRMKGTLKLEAISTEADGDPHRTMVMQIHGRLTNAQRDLIGASDNNAPPMLKIYWQDGKVRVITKKLKDLNVDDTEMLRTDAWTDGAEFTFAEAVNHEKFTLEVIASTGRIEVILNEKDSAVFDGIHLEKWGVFENYFKAGNYLGTKAAGSFARVKYYDLEVSH